MTRRSGAHNQNARPADTKTTRAPVEPPATVPEFMRLLARGLDESVMATRGGHR